MFATETMVMFAPQLIHIWKLPKGPNFFMYMYLLFVCCSEGLQIGTILGMPIAGVLCDSDLWGGWPSVFYIFGKSMSQVLFSIAATKCYIYSRGGGGTLDNF